MFKKIRSESFRFSLFLILLMIAFFVGCSNEPTPSQSPTILSPTPSSPTPTPVLFKVSIKSLPADSSGTGYIYQNGIAIVFVEFQIKNGEVVGDIQLQEGEYRVQIVLNGDSNNYYYPNSENYFFLNQDKIVNFNDFVTD